MDEKTKFPINGIKMTLSMVDVPLHIMKKFKSDVSDRYGNIYWVKLMDLMRKAEAYDMMLASMDSGMEYQDDYPKPEAKEDNGIKTFTGTIKQ